MGRYGIRLVKVNGFSSHFNVHYPVSTGHTGEIPLVIRLNAGLNRCVDGVGQTGNLKETAALLRTIPGRHLQRILNLLSRGLYDTSHIPIREHGQGVVIGNVSRLNNASDSASIAEPDISTQLRTVSICRQISQIRLSVSDNTIPRGRIIDCQLIWRGTQNCL